MGKVSAKRPKQPKLRLVDGAAGNGAAGNGAGAAGNSVQPTRSKLRTAATDDLVTWAQSGTRLAFDELVRRTHGDAYGLALRLTGNTEDARDVVQDAYLRAYKGLKNFRRDANFRTWLYRIVANCAYTQATKNRRHRHVELHDEVLVVETRPDNDPAVRGDIIALRDALEAAVQALPERLRAVVVLRDVYDLPHEAIAAELGISVSATKVRLHRARRRLREQVLGKPSEANQSTPNHGAQPHAI